MQRVPIDEARIALENDLAKPIPGRQAKKVSESVVEDEMALFKAAAAGR